MEDIKIGELVRTKKGYIEKIKTVNHYGIVIKHNNDNDDFSEDINYYAESGLEINKMDIKKHSFNLIDLLETDDIVVLEYYVKKFGKRITRKFEVFKCYALIKFNNTHCDFLYDLNEKKWTEEEYDIQIISILTHEQYEQNCYKVKGE